MKKENTHGEIRSCLLIRVSTLLDSQTSSLETQREILTNLVLSHPEEKFNPDTDVFEDRVTGTTLDRGRNSNFNRLLKELNIEIVDKSTDELDEFSIRAYKGKYIPYNKIYCKSTSRFSRASYKGQSLLLMLKNIGIEVYFYDIGKSISELTDIELSMYSLIDSDYSKKQSYNWRNHRVRQTDKKKIVFTRALYGYDIVKENGERYLRANPEESKVVKWVFAEILKGKKGTGVIADELNKKGYDFRGKPFDFERVLRMCRNQHYCGMEKYYMYDENYVYGFNPTVKNASKKLDFKWDKCEYIDELVSLEDFEAVGQIISGRRQEHKGKNIPKNKYTQILYCSKCGRHYQRHGYFEQYDDFEYHCPNTQARYNHTCDNHSFYMSYLKKKMEIQAKAYNLLVNNLYRDYIDNLKYLRIYLALYFKESGTEYLVKLLEERDELKSKLTAQLEALISDSLESDSAMEVLKAIKDKQDKKLKELDKKIETQNNLKEIIQGYIDMIDELSNNLWEQRESVKEKYSVDDYYNELESITVYPKEWGEGSRKMKNRVIFLFHTKTEAQIMKLFEDIVDDEVLKEFIKDGTIKKVDIEISHRYIVRKPTKEEIEEASTVLADVFIE